MRRSLLVFLTMFSFLSSSQAGPVATGADAPQVTAMDSEGRSVDLATFYDEGPTLVYFYPKAGTPGCTAQACNLRDAFEDLTAAGLQVVGVSRDSVEAQARFRERHRLPFPLLADKDGRVVEAFGVPSMLGFASRQSFLIVDGKVVWRDLSASPRKQADEALAALRKAQRDSPGGA